MMYVCASLSSCMSPVISEVTEFPQMDVTMAEQVLYVYDVTIQRPHRVHETYMSPIFSTIRSYLCPMVSLSKNEQGSSFSSIAHRCCS